MPEPIEGRWVTATAVSFVGPAGSLANLSQALQGGENQPFSAAIATSVRWIDKGQS